jgi:two-component system OmpR family response regulator
VAHTVAFVEDDDVIRENYTEYMEDAGFNVRAFADRGSALESLRERMPDLAVLDVALGHERDGGFQLCADLRRMSGTIPIIFLTSHDDDVNKISGLRLGADDYLSKESSIEFLIVRIETLLRRHESLRGEGTGGGVMVGDLRIDSEGSTVYWKGEIVDMPLTQLWMVESLARAPGHARSHAELMRAANIVVEPNTIAAHMKTIRQRFRQVDPDFDAIRTERGLGYRWMTTPTSGAS